MNTTFRFASAQEVTPAILDIIKNAYQEKSISIYVEENELLVPSWQMEEVRRRDKMMADHSTPFLDCDATFVELDRELEAI